MQYFTKYSKVTGEVLGHISCTSCTSMPVSTTYGFVEGMFPVAEYYIELSSGTPSAYSAEEAQQKASRPTYPARWSNELMQWVSMWDSTVAKDTALNSIDSLAGRARLRYITSVPGQAETYAKKEQQANEWAAASFTGNPPSFIAAEASALNIPPIDLANQIILLANQWSNIKGPQIEATRRKWKVAAEQATTPQELESILAQAESELNAL